MDGDIVFDHVTFGYDGQRGAAGRQLHRPRGLHLRHPGRHRLGQDLPSMHLLDRLYDLGEGQGEITDRRPWTSGVIERGYLRRNIGLVLQEPFLFSPHHTARTSPRRAPAARRRRRYAGPPPSPAWTRPCPSFPTATTRMVGERGVTLSGGQKQRVGHRADADAGRARHGL